MLSFTITLIYINNYGGYMVITIMLLWWLMVIDDSNIW
jgi:hypothetical protein